jgi:N-acetyl-anhydromuramyl-L-alanine amidase AmpD
MLTILADGMVTHNARISPRRFVAIERGPMATVSGIVVHQTGSSTEQSAFNSDQLPGANGAHFLIAKSGAIYQTASLKHRTNHVGAVRARCLAEHRCTPAELVLYRKSAPKVISRIELSKAVPARYPSNQDSIEIVGVAALPVNKPMPPNQTLEQQARFLGDDAVYEAVNAAQQTSLQYLIAELQASLQIPKTEVHRHSTVSCKNPTEAGSAQWE